VGQADEWDVGAEQMLKAEMAAFLRRPGGRIEGPLWIRAQTASCFLNAIRGDTRAKKELRVLLRGWAREASEERRKITKGAQRRSHHPGPDPNESVRSLTVAAELARLALDMRYVEDEANPTSPRGHYYQSGAPPERRERGVVSFRADYLGGQTLEPSEAARFLRSDGLRWLPAKEFRDGTRTASRCNVQAITLGESTGDDPRMPRVVQPFLIDQDHHAKLRPLLLAEDVPRLLRLPMEDGKPSGNSTEVFAGTVLDELRDVADRLSRWLLWDPAEAVWFILTGSVPDVPVLEFYVRTAPMTSFVDLEQGLRIDQKRGHRRIRLVITVEPWITVTTLARAYQYAQRVLLGVKQTHPPSSDWLKFFDFVSAHRHEGRDMPTIRKLWNDQAPREWRYRQPEHQNFIRDFWRIHRQVMQLRSADPQPRGA
jgi:hypothetical protein